MPTSQTTTSKNKKKKLDSPKWDKDHPARQLLYNEIKAGRIPMDSEDMGPAEVYFNYSDTLEFQMKGMEFGPTFVRRLRDMRKIVKKELDGTSGGPEWNEAHPARKLLYDELAAGNIPLDLKEMGPAEVYYRYSDSLEFNMDGMEYGDTFTTRLLSLQKQVK